MGMVLANPSVANHLISDPTAIRAVGFAKRERFGGVTICNRYAFRATNPKDLWKVSDPEGPDNMDNLRNLLDTHETIVVGWGAGLSRTPSLQKFLMMADMGRNLYCLGTTKDCSPRHPLYLPSDAPLRLWRRATELSA